MSTIVALVGPIEWWWDVPHDPDRFMSPAAVIYRKHRQDLNDFLVAAGGILVFRPHEAFKGDWDERGQALNDVMVQIADIIVNMRPLGIPGAGTDHELELARKAGKPIIWAEPGRSFDGVLADIRMEETFNVRHGTTSGV